MEPCHPTTRNLTKRPHRVSLQCSKPGGKMVNALGQNLRFALRQLAPQSRIHRHRHRHAGALHRRQHRHFFRGQCADAQAACLTRIPNAWAPSSCASRAASIRDAPLDRRHAVGAVARQRALAGLRRLRRPGQRRESAGRHAGAICARRPRLRAAISTSSASAPRWAGFSHKTKTGRTGRPPSS